MKLTNEQSIRLHNDFSFDMVEIITSIIDRMDKPTTDELLQAIDDDLIYTDDQWKVIGNYFSPNDDNIGFNSAVDLLIDDIISLLDITE